MTKSFTTSESFEDYLRMYDSKSNGNLVQLALNCSKGCGNALIKTYSPIELNLLSIMINSDLLSIPDYICPACTGEK
ncbi:hypothetical protein J4404_01055 [Candidatus Woesearchaeota archaeon]|nr:hypothetical protein [Candidatus Woesearchaeota archaeon]